MKADKNMAFSDPRPLTLHGGKYFINKGCHHNADNTEPVLKYKCRDKKHTLLCLPYLKSMKYFHSNTLIV